MVEVRDRDGGRRWFGSAGTAELGTGRTRQAEEQFRVGSITKTFTATVILQLAAEYVLSLEDTVEKWLPGLIRGKGHDGNRITIRHLLSHRSGLFAFTLDADMVRRYSSPELLAHRFDRWTPEELVKTSLVPCGTTAFGHGGMITGNWSYLYGTRDGGKVAVMYVNGDWNCPPLDLFPEIVAAALTSASSPL